ncbi:3-isopropylmalate dehydrogenase [Acidovorax sp. Root70]|uniref:3-isopropylmalate dehydrogenase n=1 Tax=Acidovorax sp. Root70 TaxID=1736590 RepID=UPI0007001EA4|nr:3-isopropylmalate dehydrogenase [Acidovorax sp. Root70]KRB40904.1 3-isopropylmalate dehydrogenase [Acidovorax sp. Root70]
MHRIAFLPGEGIGPEVLAQARRVLEALRGPDFDFDAVEAPVGAVACDAHGHPLPPHTLAAACAADAVLFGAVGDPHHDHLPRALRPEQAILGLRRGMGLYASLRHIQIDATVAMLSPLKTQRVQGVDVLIVRELDGDVYTALPKGQRVAAIGPFAGDAEGFDSMRYAAGEVRRVAHVAFGAARARRGQLASVDKANVLETSRLWREVVTEVGRTHYPDVQLRHLYADNAAMALVASPQDFDVVLTGNLFGDILSDLASVLTGSIGLPASALLGDGEPGRTRGLFEAGHGTALDIAGTDRANPIGCIRAAALLLRHALARPDLADRVEQAVRRALASGWRTADIADAATPENLRVGTRAMGSAVLQHLRESAEVPGTSLSLL